MTLNDWIKNTASFHSDPEIAVLELRFLAAEITGINPTKQRIDNTELNEAQQKILNKYAGRLIRGEPLAYILKYQPFFDFDLFVTPATLIPRADTEVLAERTLEHIAACKNPNPVVYDVGTGSGAIAIAIAKHYPDICIIASDYSLSALKVARYNAKKQKISNISFVQGDWLDTFADESADIIVSNPPYIAPNDYHLKNLSYEPQSALVSSNHGYSDIFTLILKSPRVLKKHGWLLIEHGIDQTDTIQKYIKKFSNWKNTDTKKDRAKRERFTEMQKY